MYNILRPYDIHKDRCERWFEENYYDALDRLEDKKLPITNDNVDRECMLMYNFQEWYDDIKDYTIPSEIYDIDIDDVQYDEYKFMRTERFSPKDILSSLCIENKFTSIREFKKYLRTDRCKDSEYVIVRDYKEIDESKEFRCFYVNNGITSISQYNDIYVHEYQNEDVQQDIIKRIQKFISNVYIPYNNAVIDIYVDDEIYIIELNYFGGHLPVGACLYDWLKDYNILYKNRITPYIRVCENVNCM